MGKGVQVRGAEVRKIRQQRFCTQQEFAASLGTTHSNIQRIEYSQTTGIGVRILRKLAEFLKTSPEDVLARIGAHGQASRRRTRRADH